MDKLLVECVFNKNKGLNFVKIPAFKISLSNTWGVIYYTNYVPYKHNINRKYYIETTINLNNLIKNCNTIEETYFILEILKVKIEEVRIKLGKEKKLNNLKKNKL